MTGSAREKRLRLLEKKRASELVAALSAFKTHGFVGWDAFPGHILDEFAKVRRTTAEPDDVLPERADDAEIKSWQARFVERVGLGGRFFLLTGIEQFPWLSCEIDRPDWLDNLIAVKGFGWTAIAESAEVGVVFYEEEQEYQAYFVSDDHTRDPDGRLVIMRDDEE